MRRGVALLYFEEERGTPLVWLSGATGRGADARGVCGMKGSQAAGIRSRVGQPDREVS